MGESKKNNFFDEHFNEQGFIRKNGEHLRDMVHTLFTELQNKKLDSNDNEDSFINIQKLAESGITINELPLNTSVYESSSKTEMSFASIALGIFFVLIIIYAFIKRIRKKFFCNIPYAPVVVTSSTHTPANAGVNYPTREPATGYQTSQSPYNPNVGYPMPQPAPVHMAPYPPSNTGMPMPQATPYPPAQPGFNAPYPPAAPVQTNPHDTLPPSYDQVVGAPTAYNKQAPYNPNYTGN